MKFRLYNKSFYDATCNVEMSEELLKEVIDPESFSLNMPGGQYYTVIPIDDNAHIVAALQKIFLCRRAFKEPTKNMHDMISKMDALADSVDSLFSEVEYIQIESKHDLEVLIKPKHSEKYDFKKKKYAVLDELYEKVTKEKPVAVLDPV